MNLASHMPQILNYNLQNGIHHSQKKNTLQILILKTTRLELLVIESMTTFVA